ncbi:MAG: hypothetical protein EHM85_08315 [Desulfobacteraceae bacterium]|nr:MAG: hypothetical protein EHM85_08315 [Desulfobacteraceae bacterium]
MKNVLNVNDLEQYLNRTTLITGEVNSGKTNRTSGILKIFCDCGYEDRIAILDLAPETNKGVGGKMGIPSPTLLYYLTDTILAPRLSGKSEEEMQKKASGNAMIIENLFIKLSESKREILFINDATLYFHAGDFNRFVETLKLFQTTVINAYYGDYFADSKLTRRERKLTEELMKICDLVIDCNKMRF